jgi:hypothetical protein
MKSMIITLSIILFIGQLACQLADAGDALGKGGTATTNAVLQESDIPGLKIEKTSMRPWCKELDVKRMPVETKGVEQYVAIQGTKALMLYAEFVNTNEAHKAAEFYSKNMASIFLPGLWDGAQKAPIGDESWYFNDVTTGLLIRSGRTCFLISCRDGDVEKRKLIAEAIAKRIEDKVKLGGRVIVPSDRQKD